MTAQKILQHIQGKTLVCQIDNQAVKGFIEKKGTSHNWLLNQIGKEIFWIQQLGDFHITLY